MSFLESDECSEFKAEVQRSQKINSHGKHFMATLIYLQFV